MRFIPEDNEFFHKVDIGIPINSEWAKEVNRILFLDSKEKALYAGSYFIKGFRDVLGKRKSATTPLYIHELELVLRNDVYFVHINDTYLNPDFVDISNSSDSKLILKFDTLAKNLPPHPFGFDNQVIIQNFFKDNFNSWDSLDIANYEKVNFDFKQYYNFSIRGESNSLRILSCLMFGIFRRPKGSLGVLNELNRLSNEVDTVPLLNQLFGLEKFEFKKVRDRSIYLPTTLSKNQEAAIYGVDTYSITQIVGPPGTGKSYTISALAIDAISNGKSVLVLSRTLQASRVISNIVENKFGLKGHIIKAYNQVYKRSLITKLSNAAKVDERRNRNPSDLAKRIRALIRQIRQVEGEMVDIGNSEYKWGEFFSQNRDDFFSLFKSKWYEYKRRSSEPIWTLNARLNILRKEKTRLVRRYIKAKLNYDISLLVNRRKLEFHKLNDVLKESGLTQLDEKINRVDYNLILQALPLWTTTTNEISKCLPLVKELFDLIIFDESSQCDLATAIPAIYRAKKLVVVGDPHQLRHISFLSIRKQNELRHRYSVPMNIPDYRKDSLIDCTNTVLSNPDQTTYLNEHFRSRTDIIQFSNYKFYDNKLKLIRSNPISDASKSIEVIRVDGERDSNGVNSIEIKRLLSVVDTIMEKSQSAKLILPSIGICSPFTEQVKQIKKDLSKAVTFDKVKRHNILIGTPFHFQGEERDIMLISFVIDQHSSPMTMNYLNRKDVFNVLITRARNKQYIFVSVDAEKLKPTSLLREYLQSSFATSALVNQDDSFDKFVIEVSEFLVSSGFELVRHATVISGMNIDIVVVHEERCYCIDLIGYPGAFEDQISIDNLRILNRIDLPIFFLPYSSWYLEKNKSKRNLLNFILSAEEK